MKNVKFEDNRILIERDRSMAIVYLVIQFLLTYLFYIYVITIEASLLNKVLFFFLPTPIIVLAFRNFKIAFYGELIIFDRLKHVIYKNNTVISSFDEIESISLELLEEEESTEIIFHLEIKLIGKPYIEIMKGKDIKIRELGNKIADFTNKKIYISKGLG